MEDRKAIYNIHHDMWMLTEKYGYKKLTDAQWEQFVAEGYALQEKYRKVGRDMELMFRDAFRAVQQYYEHKKEPGYEG